MIGRGKGLDIAMIMYEDNARLINETLAAIAPDARLRHDRARPRRRDADAAPLARRRRRRRHARRPHAARPPTGSARRRWRCPSSARRRAFPTGRSGSLRCCAARSSSWPGSTAAARDYELRFAELADFSDLAGRAAPSAMPPCARRSSATWRRSRRCAARRPTTGSISSTTGPTTMPPRLRPARPERRAFARRLAALVALAAAGPGRSFAAAAGFDLGRADGAAGAGEVRRRHLHRIAQRARARPDARLLGPPHLPRARRPSCAKRSSRWPETMAVEGNTLTLSQGERSADPAARRLARGRRARRGDPRHAHRQPRRARAPVHDERRRRRRHAGRSSSCRANRACAARWPRCASRAANRRCARCRCCSPTATAR